MIGSETSAPKGCDGVSVRIVLRWLLPLDLIPVYIVVVDAAAAVGSMFRLRFCLLLKCSGVFEFGLNDRFDFEANN